MATYLDWAPNRMFVICWSTTETPNVASMVSAGRPASFLTTRRSMTAPAAAVTANAAGSAAKKLRPITCVTEYAV